MTEVTQTPSPKNLDIKCLRCGAMNIPENKICGRCGANLALVYDEEGKVLDWKKDPYYQAVFKKGGSGQGTNADRVRWLFRLGILLAAFLFALYILHHH